MHARARKYARAAHESVTAATQPDAYGVPISLREERGVADDHDVPISPKEIVEQGLMSQADWDTVSGLFLLN
eukprot:1157755-Pelagomonas_calceolata.AAC.5